MAWQAEKLKQRQMLEATKKLIARRDDLDKFWLACAYIGVGEKDRAIECLEQDCENHGTVAVSLKSNPLFDLFALGAAIYRSDASGASHAGRKSRERNRAGEKHRGAAI